MITLKYVYGTLLHCSAIKYLFNPKIFGTGAKLIISKLIISKLIISKLIRFKIDKVQN
jgi:hypothetical protein